jgi:hypothetical protein
MSPNVKTGRWLSGSHQGHDWAPDRRWHVHLARQDDADRHPRAPGRPSAQRLSFADEVYNATEIDQGADPKIRDQERTLAERLISELSETEFHPEKYEDEYRQRLLKAIEQKIAGQEIQRVEVEARPPTTDLVATLQASLGRKELAKVSPGKSKREPVSEKRPVRRKRAS